MKHFITDLIGITGTAMLCYGVFLQFGLPIALIVGGGLLLLYALYSARGKR